MLAGINPTIDYYALAPEIIVVATIVVVLLVDVLGGARRRVLVPRLAALGVVAALIPVITLAWDGTDRAMFGGGFVVDNYSLVFTGFFLVVTYITLLLSFDYIEDGDYHEGEYYLLILTSLLGLMVMASARDLISIFVALETISIPTFVLAAWRKHDRRSNEAGIKFYLIGVISSAVMLYGMSLIFGLTGSTLLSEISRSVREGLKPLVAASGQPSATPLLAVAIFLVLVGFAFKISAVPFHFWAPDTYEGAPTPVTAFLAVASKAGGFVALLTVVYFGFYPPGSTAGPDAWGPVLWVLSVASIVVGNLAALRQSNIVRMLAYSGIAQAGFILVPLAAAPSAAARQSAFQAVVVYLLIYGLMNLGAFAVVIALARRTGSAEIPSYSGLGTTDPVMAVLMSIFMFSLAGVPPLAGWFAKFVMFRSAVEAHTTSGYVLAVIAAVFSVVAFFYYARVIRTMWLRPASAAAPVPAVDVRRGTPPALAFALALCAVGTVAIGVYPQIVGKIGELVPVALIALR